MDAALAPKKFGGAAAAAAAAAAPRSFNAGRRRHAGTARLTAATAAAAVTVGVSIVESGHCGFHVHLHHFFVLFKNNSKNTMKHG